MKGLKALIEEERRIFRKKRRKEIRRKIGKVIIELTVPIVVLLYLIGLRYIDKGNIF